MSTGAVTGYIDVAQLVLYAFWIFFAGLIYYLHRENKREGYPLESDRSGRVVVQGFPRVPAPKTYRLADGRTVSAPSDKRDARALAAAPVAPWPGAPLQPTGDPMTSAVGPGAYAERADVPDVTIDGEPRLLPLRVATEFTVAHEDPDPRGMPVIGADGAIAGRVRDVWVDRSEAIARYLEADLENGRRVMLPINFARVSERDRCVRVASILSGQFQAVPALRNPDRITMLEEERVTAYYGGGTLYAEPSRIGPWL